jgi:hypothetical protein
MCFKIKNLATKQTGLSLKDSVSADFVGQISAVLIDSSFYFFYCYIFVEREKKMSHEIVNAFESDEESNQQEHVDSQPADKPEKAEPDESFFSSKRLALFVEDEKPNMNQSQNQTGGSSSPPSKLISRSLQPSGLSGPEFMRAFDDNFIRRTHDDKKVKATIKLNIAIFSLKTKVMSLFHEIAGLPWRLAAKTENSKRTNSTRFFSIYIDCHPESQSTLWAADALVEFRLIAQKPCGNDFTRHFTNTFSFNSNNWGFPSFIEFNEIINPEKGFIKDDKVVIEAHIQVYNVVGINLPPIYDFLSNSNLTDGTFIVEGTKLYITKAYLALYSPVFEAMFYGSFVEKDKKEIPIEDVILEEFVELLNVVYPSHKSITTKNVEYLLELGDKFQISYVMDACEKFLQTTTDIQCIQKLVWADTYAFSNLHHACIQSLDTINSFKLLKNHEEYRKISDTTKAALFEKVMKIV